MTRKRILIAAAVLAVPALALAWWLGSPLFIDRAVNEEFRSARTPPSPPA